MMGDIITTNFRIKKSKKNLVKGKKKDNIKDNI